MVNSFGTSLLDALYPNCCALCGLASGRPLPLCLACEADLTPNRDPCERCAIQLPTTRNEKASRLCGNCLRHPPPFVRALAPWLYSEYFAHLIHLWKFKGERQLTPLLAALWLNAAEWEEPRIDVLVPVPLHWRKQWQRGFNQAELFCRELPRQCPALRDCKIETQLLRRTHATAAQSSMSAVERARNMRAAFTVRKPCDNLRIAIVDDVLTTGATATAVANALAEAGAVHIELWCLARTPLPGH